MRLGGQFVRFFTIRAKLQKGDKLYLSTDGYKDQFGGPFSKKFMSKQLRELIIENSSKQMNKQKDILEQKIEEWRTGLGLHMNKLMIYQ